MPRPPAKRARKPKTTKRPARVKQAAQPAAADDDQVRQDLDKLLKSLETLGVQALREVSDRALVLIAERSGDEKRGFIAGVVGGALSIGESITGLFAKSTDEPAPLPASRPRRVRSSAAKPE